LRDLIASITRYQDKKKKKKKNIESSQPEVKRIRQILSFSVTMIHTRNIELRRE